MSTSSSPRITIRLTPEEHAEIVAKAGTTPLAQFVREQALAGASERRKAPVRAPVKDHAALAQVLAKLGGSEPVRAFRDAARGVEEGVMPTGEETDARLEAIRDELSAIRSLLMRALRVAER